MIYVIGIFEDDHMIDVIENITHTRVMELKAQHEASGFTVEIEELIDLRIYL